LPLPLNHSRKVGAAECREIRAGGFGLDRAICITTKVEIEHDRFVLPCFGRRANPDEQGIVPSPRAHTLETAISSNFLGNRPGRFGK